MTSGVIRFGLAIVSAVLTYMAVGAIGLFLLMATWPGYAEATPGKTYSLGMLWGRLGVALLSALAAGVAAGGISGTRAAWTAGAILVAAAGWIHLALVWADYAVWYHVAYLLPLPLVVAAAAWPFERRRTTAR